MEVHDAGDTVRDFAARDAAGEAGDERDSLAAFLSRTLAAAEGSGAALIPRAVVGAEDDERVGRGSGSGRVRPELRLRSVELFHHVTVYAKRRLASELRRRR